MCEIVTRGKPATSGGQSHSWLTATTRSPRPRAKSISVAAERSEAMRRGMGSTKQLTTNYANYTKEDGGNRDHTAQASGNP